MTKCHMTSSNLAKRKFGKINTGKSREVDMRFFSFNFSQGDKTPEFAIVLNVSSNQFEN